MAFAQNRFQALEIAKGQDAPQATPVEGEDAFGSWSEKVLLERADGIGHRGRTWNDCRCGSTAHLIVATILQPCHRHTRERVVINRLCPPLHPSTSLQIRALLRQAQTFREPDAAMCPDQEADRAFVTG